MTRGAGKDGAAACCSCSVLRRCPLALRASRCAALCVIAVAAQRAPARIDLRLLAPSPPPPSALRPPPPSPPPEPDEAATRLREGDMRKAQDGSGSGRGPHTRLALQHSDLQTPALQHPSHLQLVCLLPSDTEGIFQKREWTRIPSPCPVHPSTFFCLMTLSAPRRRRCARIDLRGEGEAHA
eukprot:321943-Chlamydomonas_euryale.AAC.6